jgi:parallel beta-helix repeat protein
MKLDRFAKWLLSLVFSLVFFPLFAFLVSVPARASDGVLEINQTCAVQTGCFANDTPGFPVTISAPGSYRLTSGLSQTNFPGLTTPTNAIWISASRVHLDLGGHSISCTSLSLPCGGSGHGVTSASGVEGVRITNGVIQGMPDSGVSLVLAENASVEDLQTLDNGGHGIYVGFGSTIKGSVAARNGSNGFSASGRSIVTDCTATGNGGDGIFAGPGSTIVGNSSSDNGIAGIDAREGSAVIDNVCFSNDDDGIQAINGSAVNGNTVHDNGQYGIDFGATDRSAYRDNTVTNNGAGTVNGNGTDAGGNLCTLSLGCP